MKKYVNPLLVLLALALSIYNVILVADMLDLNIRNYLIYVMIPFDIIIHNMIRIMKLIAIILTGLVTRNIIYFNAVVIYRTIKFLNSDEFFWIHPEVITQYFWYFADLLL